MVIVTGDWVVPSSVTDCDEIEQVVRVQRHGVRVPQERLPAGAVGVDEWKRTAAHGLGLRGFHLEMGAQDVAQIQRLGPARQGRQAPHQKRYGRQHVEEEEAGSAGRGGGRPLTRR